MAKWKCNQPLGVQSSGKTPGKWFEQHARMAGWALPNGSLVALKHVAHPIIWKYIKMREVFRWRGELENAGSCSFFLIRKYGFNIRMLLLYGAEYVYSWAEKRKAKGGGGLCTKD